MNLTASPAPARATLTITTDGWGQVVTCSAHGATEIVVTSTGTGLLGGRSTIVQAACGCLSRTAA
jgi:hypothetical protein